MLESKIGLEIVLIPQSSMSDEGEQCEWGVVCCGGRGR